MEDRKSAVPASLSGLFHHPLLARLQSADNLCFAPSLISLLPPMILIGYCIWYRLDIFVYFCHQNEVFIFPSDIDRILYLILLLIGYFCHQCDVFIAPTILIGFPSQSICKQPKLQQIAEAINLLLVYVTQRRVLSLMWFKGNLSFNIMYCFTSPNKPIIMRLFGC